MGVALNFENKGSTTKSGWLLTDCLSKKQEKLQYSDVKKILFYMK
jgi:hypothetical protein